MITHKLRNSAATTKMLMVQFSDRLLPLTLQKFYENCKEEKVNTKRSNINDYELNFYLVETQQQIEIGEIQLYNLPSNCTFSRCILYITENQQEVNIQESQPIKRTLLLREGLEQKYYFQYQFQNTLSSQESLLYLCELSAATINSRFNENIDFYDQRVGEIKGKDADNELQSLWKNVLYQIPGLGKQKCVAIAEKYPTYQCLLKNEKGLHDLKNTAVTRGAKEGKLGKVLAERIYKCLTSVNGSENVLHQQ